MKILSIFAIVLFAIFAPAFYAQAYDSQSINNHYNQYSPDNLSNPYSQTEVQYSPKNLSSPYSQFEVQYAPEKVSSLAVQEDHDYHVSVMTPANQGQAAQKGKGSAEDAAISNFFGSGKSKRNIPAFFYLLAISTLAVLATTMIIISIFKK